MSPNNNFNYTCPVALAKHVPLASLVAPKQRANGTVVPIATPVNTVGLQPLTFVPQLPFLELSWARIDPKNNK